MEMSSLSRGVHYLDSFSSLTVFKQEGIFLNVQRLSHRHQLSTILNFNYLLKWWERPQLRKFYNHRLQLQHGGVYTQLTKIFSTLLSINSTLFFFKNTIGFMKCIKYTKWNVFIWDNPCYVMNTCCRLMFCLLLFNG